MQHNQGSTIVTTQNTLKENLKTRGQTEPS